MRVSEAARGGTPSFDGFSVFFVTRNARFPRPSGAWQWYFRPLEERISWRYPAPHVALVLHISYNAAMGEV
jgi:hypothetical protein